jgi:8-oxo-dGTP pyrophosphatase MutT (NUDIX family)
MSSPQFTVIAEGAIVRGGRYLMIVRSLDKDQAPGALAFPGGKIEATDGPDSVLEEALRREITEEMGIDVGDEMRYVESGSFTLHSGDPAVWTVFLCRYDGDSDAKAASPEVDSVAWMTVPEILDHPKAPEWMPDIIDRTELLRKRVGW